MTPSHKNTAMAKLLLAAFSIGYALFSLAYCMAGPINHDEGWYLTAARLVGQGKILYRDFAFTQPPLLPYLYAIPLRIFDGGMPLGRAITMAFSLACFLLTVSIARRLAGTRAAVVAAGLSGLAGYQIWQFSVVKALAVPTFLALGSVYFFVLDERKRRYAPYASVLLMILATATRITFLPAAAVIGAYYLHEYWKRSDRREAVKIAFFGLAVTVALFAPFILMAPRQILFDVVLFHNINLSRAAPSAILHRKLALCIEYFKFFPHVGLMLVPAAIYTVKDFKSREFLCLHNKKLILFAVFLLVFLSQWLAGTAQKHYQSNVIPLLVILLASAEAGLYEKAKWRRLMNCFVALCIVISLSHSQKGLAAASIDKDGEAVLPIENLKEIGRFLREHTTPGATIFTQHAYVAVEARRNVTPGMEMSIFSYFPDWSTEKSLKYRVTNNELLFRAIMEAEPEAVVLSEDSFWLAQPHFRPLSKAERPTVTRWMQGKYYLARTFPSLHRKGQPFRVYLRNK